MLLVWQTVALRPDCPLRCLAGFDFAAACLKTEIETHRKSFYLCIPFIFFVCARLFRDQLSKPCALFGRAIAFMPIAPLAIRAWTRACLCRKMYVFYVRGKRTSFSIRFFFDEQSQDVDVTRLLLDFVPLSQWQDVHADHASTVQGQMHGYKFSYIFHTENGKLVLAPNPKTRMNSSTPMRSSWSSTWLSTCNRIRTMLSIHRDRTGIGRTK